MTMQKRSFATRCIASLRAHGPLGFLAYVWTRWWMLFAGVGPAGRLATQLATWFVPPHYGQWQLRSLNPKGFVAPSASLYGKNIHFGPTIYVDDQTVIYQREDGGPIDLGIGATVCRGTIIETSLGGSVNVGEGTTLQAHCFLSAAQGSIRIGANVNIAPYCAFYPHGHGTASGQNTRDQALVVKGDIVVEDGAWLGHGVTVLSGVRIGKGAVIGAGSTVASNVPDDAFAWGVPAKVFMKRKAPLEASGPNEKPISRDTNPSGGAL